MLIRLYLKTGARFVEVAVGLLNFSIVRVERPQPYLFPENSAAVLAPVVSISITPRSVQDHHVALGETPKRPGVSYAGLVDPTLDAKRFSAPTEHFRHKWKAIQSAVIVKRGQYFICRSNHYPVSDEHPF
jgi:hypothetical protein